MKQVHSLHASFLLNTIIISSHKLMLHALSYECFIVLFSHMRAHTRKHTHYAVFVFFPLILRISISSKHLLFKGILVSIRFYQAHTNTRCMFHFREMSHLVHVMCSANFNFATSHHALTCHCHCHFNFHWHFFDHLLTLPSPVLMAQSSFCGNCVLIFK